MTSVSSIQQIRTYQKSLKIIFLNL